MAIQGEGYFEVSLPDGRTAYTRDGSFERDATGKLVTVDGYEVQPGITIPNTANSVTISPDGVVSAVLNNDTNPTQLGQLQLARFVNKGGLESIGNNMFTETAASGSAQVGVPNADGTGNIMQSYLEDANVNAVTEIADLIAAQRAYEMNARVVTGADEMLSTTSQMR
jgi:flagellar basal-body rod protein FlgG